LPVIPQAKTQNLSCKLLLDWIGKNAVRDFVQQFLLGQQNGANGTK